MGELGVALGLVRAVTTELLSREDARSLDLGVAGLEVQEALEGLGIEPEYIEPSDPAADLERAARILNREAGGLPLGIWVRIQGILRAGLAG